MSEEGTPLHLMATVGVTEQGDMLYSTGFVAQHCQCSRHTPLNVKWNLTDILFNISLHLPTSPSMSVFVPSLRGMLLCGFYCLLRPITAVPSAQTGSLNLHKIQTRSSHILWITDKYFQEWTQTMVSPFVSAAPALQLDVFFRVMINKTSFYLKTKFSIKP